MKLDKGDDGKAHKARHIPVVYSRCEVACQEVERYQVLTIAEDNRSKAECKNTCRNRHMGIADPSVCFTTMHAGTHAGSK